MSKLLSLRIAAIVSAVISCSACVSDAEPQDGAGESVDSAEYALLDKITDTPTHGNDVRLPRPLASGRDSSVDAAEDVLDAIGKLAPEERMNTYFAQTPVMKYAMWRTHIERYRMNHPDITSEQTSVLEMAIDALSPSLFEISQDSADRAEAVDRRLDKLHEQAVRAFGEEEAGVLLSRLLPIHPSADQPECGCNVAYQGSDTCNVWRQTCASGGCTFRYGCGAYLVQGCDGRCVNLF